MDPLEHAEQLKRLIVEPVVQALEAKVEAALKPLVDEQTAQKNRMSAAEQNIATLQSKWAKVLTAFFIWSTIASILIGLATQKIKKLLGI